MSTTHSEGVRVNVFISWSGTASRKLAEIFRGWLPAVIQSVKPYFSPDDIEKGTRWPGEISKMLEQSVVGVICLTPANLSAPWLMFEAGALAKSVDRSRVIPLLFGVPTSELSGPLLQFQAAAFQKDEIRKVLRTINSAMGANALENPVLDSVFDKWWPDLEAAVSRVMVQDIPERQATQRTDREILEEILQLSRAQVYDTAQIDPIMLRPVDELELTVRVVRVLKAAGITCVGDLVQLTEPQLLEIPLMPPKGPQEIKEVLGAHDLMLGVHIPGRKQRVRRS